MSLTRRRFVSLGLGAGLGLALPEVAGGLWRGIPWGQPLRLGYLALPRPGPAGLSAAFGAALAIEESRRAAELLGRQVILVSGTAQASEIRRSIRVMAEQGVVAIAGTGDAEWSEMVSREAEARRLVYLNIGCGADRLRSECQRATFHVEASTAMYLDALAEGLVGEGMRRWCVVAADAAIAERARRAVEKNGGILVESSVVASPDRDRALRDVRAIHADAVCLAAPDETCAFHPESIDGSLAIRPVLWHPSLSRFGAAQLNQRFERHFRRPFDSAAWAGWFALKTLWEAAMGGDGPTAAGIAKQLRDGDARFEGHKGPPLTFRPWDHQLRQPIYLMRTELGGATRLIEAPRANLDSLGDLGAARPCELT